LGERFGVGREGEGLADFGKRGVAGGGALRRRLVAGEFGGFV